MYVPDFYEHEFWRFVFLQQKVGEYAQTFIEYPADAARELQS